MAGDHVDFKVPWRREKYLVQIGNFVWRSPYMLVPVWASTCVYTFVPVCTCLYLCVRECRFFLVLAQLFLLQEIHLAPLYRGLCSLISESHLQKFKWHCVFFFFFDMNPSLLVTEGPSSYPTSPIQVWLCFLVRQYCDHD